MLNRIGIDKTLYAQCPEQKHHFPNFIMARRKSRKLNSPNFPLDPQKSRGGNIKDGMGVVKGTNVKGEAFIFDPSKHKRDPLTGKWATKPDVVKPQKDRKKATKPTSSEAKKTKPPSPFAKFRQRVRDALKQQLLDSSKPESAKPTPTDYVPTVAKGTKPVEKKNLTLEEYTQRGQEISSKYGSTQKNLDPKPEPAEPKPTTPKQVSKEYTDTINSAKSKISQFKLDRLVKVFETQDAQINAEIKSLDPKNLEDVEKAQKLFARKRKLKQSLDIYLEKQMNLLYQELLDNNNSVNSDLLVGQTNFQIGEYTKNLKPANTEDPIYKTHTPVISKALAEFHKLTGGILNNLVPRIGLSEKKRSWAGFDAQEPQKNNYLSISVTRSNDVKPSVFHEAAHLLEGSDPKFANLAKEFLAKNRTSDELKQIKGYPAGEVAYPGNWVHPYVGKIYKNSPSTEVISMGIERFASPKDMAEFYFKDKEHFALTLGIIESLKVPQHLKPIPATIY